MGILYWDNTLYLISTYYVWSKKIFLVDICQITLEMFLQKTSKFSCIISVILARFLSELEYVNKV
jgi:hypothetical protein